MYSIGLTIANDMTTFLTNSLATASAFFTKAKSNWEQTTVGDGKII
jgi:hypothetical protein